LVPPKDPAALALALDRVLAIGHEERQERARLAIDFVRANFTRRLMGERTLAVYAEVLGQTVRENEAA